MEKSLLKIMNGYQAFRKKYALGDQSVMQHLSLYGQNPEIMVVSCCDSRVDPALILQCEPGDLFVVRNVANIIPPYERDDAHHGTSAALEFGLCSLKVKHLILLGHSQCGGIAALFDKDSNKNESDFISAWVSIIKKGNIDSYNIDEYAKIALNQSFQNCMTFPWIKERVMQNKLKIHVWYFDIKMGKIFSYSETHEKYESLAEDNI